MTKHTATPWTWRGHADLNGLCHINAENKTIVQVWDFPEAEANAAFICRACNSHEALKEALNGLISASATVFDHTQAHLKNSVKLDYLTYKAKAEQALKLAEGRE